MGIKALILVTILCLPTLAFGQEDSLYIERFPNQITIRGSLSSLSNSFKIRSLEDDLTLLLKPNTRDRLGMSVQFRALELSFGFTPNVLHQKKELDNSKLFVLNTRLFLGRWIQSLELYSQRGYFGEILGVELLYPEFKTTKIGGSTAYIFNEKFSFRAIRSQHEWQKKSAGSFIPRAYFYYTHFNWDYTDFGFDSHSYDLAVGPGYHYNLVIGRHFLISLGAAAAAGINVTSYDQETFNSLLLEGNIRSGIGYNSKRFFAGFDSNFIVLEHNEDRKARMDDRITFLEFYLGYRFDAPKKLLKLADKINAKLPL